VVRYDFARSTLSGSGKTAIDSLLTLYDAGRRLSGIELSGYCDTIGSNSCNDRLARSRVGSVRDYLHSRNFPDSLIQRLQGYGKRRPLNDNSNEELRSLNRRVEIVFHVILPAPDRKSPASQEADPILLTDAFKDTVGLVGKNVVLRNVNFYGDRHTPLPNAFSELEKLAKLMLAHPGLQIEIQGYVCCLPETMDGYDADIHKEGLSIQRAKFVYLYLIDKGVSSSRLSYKGFGASHKLYPQENDAREREGNRRVEIKVLSW
jgi:outer membrane protein OmpA-like peptidoglycan-associated protein